MPTARRCLARPGVPAGNAARRISSVNSRPRTGAGSRTAPSRTATGIDAPDSERSRTSVGRRTSARGGAIRSDRSETARGARQRTHAVRPSSHEPIHGRAVPSNALEARNPGRPSKRPEDS